MNLCGSKRTPRTYLQVADPDGADARSDQLADTAPDGFNHATKLGPEDLIRLDGLISRAKTLDRVIVGDQSAFAWDVRSLGLRPSFGRLASEISPVDPEFCKPLIRPSAG